MLRSTNLGTAAQTLRVCQCHRVTARMALRSAAAALCLHENNPTSAAFSQRKWLITERLMSISCPHGGRSLTPLCQKKTRQHAVLPGVKP